MGAAERQSLADALDMAAGRLADGVDRRIVDESIRTAIAAQPTSRHWASAFSTIIQNANAPEIATYSTNLRRIANELRRQ